MSASTKLMVIIGAQISQFEDAMRNVDKAIKKTERQFKGLDKIGERFERAGKSLSIGLTLPLAAAGGAALKFAMDAVESENLFSVSMGKMEDSARAWSEQLSDALGINEYNLRKNLGIFNVMLDSMGMGEQASYDMAKGLTQLSYDMASFYNLKPEEAFEKLQSGISGEVEPLKRLGIIINETTVKAYAYKTGIAKTGEALSEQQKVLARYGAIMEATSKAQGDLARTAEDPANKLRKLTERSKELAVDLGTVLIPMFDKVVGALNKVVTWFSNLDEGQKKTIVKIAMVAAALGPTLIIMGKMAQAVIALTAAKNVLAASTIGQKLIPMIGKLGKALLFLATNPVGWAIIAIAGLVAIGIYVYKNWDKVKVQLIAIWEVIRASAENTAIKIGVSWNTMKLAIYKVVAGILDAVSPLLKWLPGAMTKNFETMRAGVHGKIADVEDNLRSLSARSEENESRMRAALVGVSAAFKSTSGDWMNYSTLISQETTDMSYQTTEDITKMGTGLEGVQKKMKDTGNAAKDLKEKAQKALSEATSRLDDFGKNIVDALRKRYEEERDKRREAKDNEIADEQKAHDEKMKILDKEHEATLRNIDASMKWRMGGVRGSRAEAINDQIDALNSLTEAENKAREQQEYQSEKAELEKRVAAAKTAEEKQKALDDLEKFNADHERKVLQDQRETQIDALREESGYLSDIASIRSDMANSETDEERQRHQQDLDKKLERLRKALGDEAVVRAQGMLAEMDAIERQTIDERTLAKTDHDEKVRLAKSVSDEKLKLLTKELEDIKAHFESVLTEESLNAESRKLIIGKNQDEILALLDKYNKGWRDKGQSFGESLIQGLESVKGTVQAKVSELLSLVTQGQAASRALQGKTYKVQSGDTLSKISKAYGVSISDLIDANNLGSSGKISAGQVLKIPGLATGGIALRAGMALVGEKGPELLNLPKGAAVAPLPGGYGGNINITVTGNHIASDYDVRRMAEQMVKEIRRKTGWAF